MNEISTEEQIYSCLAKIPRYEMNSFLIRKEGIQLIIFCGL